MSLSWLEDVGVVDGVVVEVCLVGEYGVLVVLCGGDCLLCGGWLLVEYIGE